MTDDNPNLATAPWGVGRQRCALRRPAKKPVRVAGLRLFKA